MYGTHFLGALVIGLADLFVAGRIERTRRALPAAPHPTVGAFFVEPCLLRRPAGGRLDTPYNVQ
jgi:hypothetical protein